MTRKHFELLARSVANDPSPKHDRVKVANFLANFCETVNARFDRDRFMTACGLQFKGENNEQ